MRRGCIWCGDRSGPFSDEHAIAKWISRAFQDRYGIHIPEIETPNFKVKATEIEGWFFNEDDPDRDPTKLVGLKVLVCEACNNGWMGDMEEAVMSTLPALMFGDPVALDPSQQVDLAAWAAKTLINLGFEGHSRSHHQYPTKLRDYVRETGRPPDDVLIVAASITGLECKLKSRVREMKLQSQGGRLLGMAPLTTTLIDRVAFQMMNPTVDWPLSHSAVSVGAAIQLWPVPGGTIVWPPASSIEADRFDDFADPDDEDILNPTERPAP